MKQQIIESHVQVLLEGEYHDLFRAKLKEFGVTSPAHLSKDWKKHFFTHVKKVWQSRKKKRKA